MKLLGLQPLMTEQNHLEFLHQLSPNYTNMKEQKKMRTDPISKQNTQRKIRVIRHTAKRKVDLFSISPIILLLAFAVLEVVDIRFVVSFFDSRFIKL